MDAFVRAATIHALILHRLVDDGANVATVDLTLLLVITQVKQTLDQSLLRLHLFAVFIGSSPRQLGLMDTASLWKRHVM